MLNFLSTTLFCLQNISSLIHEWSNKGEYLQDMQFLAKVIWPIVEHDYVAHDAYSCEEFRDTRPFPTKRYSNYQHVGQLFDSHDRPRMDDINKFIRGVATPPPCRTTTDWVFG